DEDDGEEDDAEPGLETRGPVERVAEGVHAAEPALDDVVDEGEGEGSHPRSFEPEEPADDGYGQHVDRPRQVDRPGGDLAVVPDAQDPGDRGDERPETE